MVSQFIALKLKLATENIVALLTKVVMDSKRSEEEASGNMPKQFDAVLLGVNLQSAKLDNSKKCTIIDWSACSFVAIFYILIM